VDLKTFLQHRQQRPRDRLIQAFTAPGRRPTVVITSYIWWTDCLAHALWQLGCNVIVAEAWHGLYLSDHNWANFPAIFDLLTEEMRRLDVDLVIGGNTSALAIHPRTGRTLHDAIGVPLVNYWWDEPRALPAMCRRGVPPADYFAALRRDDVLNVFWDDDVRREMQDGFALDRSMHLPLATTPELWPTSNLPLARRSIDVCFLGNLHGDGRCLTLERDDPDALLAQQLAAAKVEDPTRSMIDCIGELAESDLTIHRALGHTGDDERAYHRAMRTWSMVGDLLNHQRRDVYVQALAEHLGDRLVIIGRDWEKLGLRAAEAESGIPRAGGFYGQSRVSLNLFGGCVHGGMSMRPYDIAASGGLILTAHNRELTDLFTPGRECLSFSRSDELIGLVDDVLASPGDYDDLVRAGQRRTREEHTWRHRLARLLAAASDRWNLPHAGAGELDTPHRRAG
jgi:hypothetical protein